MNYRQKIIERDLKIILDNLEKLTNEETDFYVTIKWLNFNGKEITTHQFNYLQDIAKQVPKRLLK